MDLKKTKKMSVSIICTLCIILNVFCMTAVVGAESNGEYTPLQLNNSYYSIANVDQSVIDSVYTIYPQLDELLDLYVEKNYYELDREQAINSMLRKFIITYTEMFPYMADSLMKSVDEFSGYYPYTTSEELFDNNTYSGFGFVMNCLHYENGKGYGVAIKRIFKDSPADLSGLKKGDRFSQIDGIDVSEMNLDLLSDFLRTFEENKEVNLVFLRGEKNEKISVTIKRNTITKSAVFGEIIDEDKKIAYLEIADFLNDNMLDELYEMLSYFSEKGIKNIVIDVRNNTGGDVGFAINAVNMFVKDKDVDLIKLQYRNNEEEIVKSNGIGFNMEKVTILVNSQTASAAEYFAIAMRDVTNATIIGKKTYGKGIGQGYYNLDDGATIGITELELISPKGTKYHKIGVIPDIDIDMLQKEIKKIDEFEQFNFVNARTVKKDADNKAVLALNQRLAIIGYIKYSDITSKMNEKSLHAIKVFQHQYDLPVNEDDLGYEFVQTLNYLSSFGYSKYIDGDSQLECAKISAKEGITSAKNYAKSIDEANKSKS